MLENLKYDLAGVLLPARTKTEASKKNNNRLHVKKKRVNAVIRTRNTLKKRSLFLMVTSLRSCFLMVYFSFWG